MTNDPMIALGKAVGLDLIRVGAIPEFPACPACSGDGRAVGGDGICPACAGSGRTQEEWDAIFRRLNSSLESTPEPDYFPQEPPRNDRTD